MSKSNPNHGGKRKGSGIKARPYLKRIATNVRLLPKIRAKLDSFTDETNSELIEAALVSYYDIDLS